MRVSDLDHKELLELDPEGGIIRFAGQRAILLDTVAMGLLRKYLVESFGVAAARTVLTQFGFAHGWRMAEAMQTEFEWDSNEDWRQAGLQLNVLGGFFRIEPKSKSPLSKEGLTLLESYEAEQHLLHLGCSDTSVCWTICGLTSGYLSRTLGKELYAIEDHCSGKGDAACHLFARSREEWGDEHINEVCFFDSTRLKDYLDVSLQRVTETLKAAERKLRTHQKALAGLEPDIEIPLGIIAKSAKMSQMIGLARRVAKVDTTILITGESGAGKEKIARLMHDESSRAAGPFIAVNCGAITETLLESELFGHVRGAFTGASQERPGLFEAANDGTLFLDEIGEVSSGMQVKLLRVLQEREVRRVGDNKARKVNVRILAATNRDLPQAIISGTFRQDLYYRLKVVELHVPALRERHDDILPLAQVLFAGAALRMKRTILGLTAPCADQLLRYSWPGNVRELENAMERAVALARGDRLELEDLPEEVRTASRAIVVATGMVRPLGDIEKDYILQVFAQNSRNQAHTAEQLQIGAATLHRKLKSYDAFQIKMPKPKGPFA
jgi:two-component system response regulator HydG